KIDRFTARYSIATVRWPHLPLDPFFNANTTDDLAEAERLALLDEVECARSGALRPQAVLSMTAWYDLYSVFERSVERLWQSASVYRQRFHPVQPVCGRA